MESSGYLEIFFGPMFSGKTTKLNNTIAVLKETNLSIKILYVNYIDDNKRKTTSSDDNITTHNPFHGSLIIDDKLEHRRVSKLEDVNDIDNFDVIAIDEGHFFGDIVKMVTLWIKEKKKTIYIAALDGDSDQKKFGTVLDLCPLADKFQKCRARCKKCQDILQAQTLGIFSKPEKAPFTKSSVIKTEQKLIGGPESYFPVCRYHSTN